MTIFDKLLKREKSNQLQIGDWVNSYSKGIYRIEHIIDQFYDESYPVLGENKIGDRINDRIIVTKRFLNSKFKKSISYESCSEAFVSKLDESQNSELKRVIEKHPKLLDDLNNYEIPTRETIYNMPLQIDNESDLKKVNGLIDFIKTGKSFLEIRTKMEQSDLVKLKPKHFGNYLFQLINYNDEYLNKKKIWRNAILTKK
ncbi:hypothetical protein BWZ20_00505 [Winogradskyella sp. J14-2]|uniref:hypothetical protein n=1 Tax=Winogradskyella sp. J14-2 TaxID=1936080 RepID=UPI0009727675|nr:hypothetical protein [Winogradskyella sp. J14-2]APY06867.1 hypothetical protein BWZ20_00505 [Winogradskyella sp. J14-2]